VAHHLDILFHDSRTVRHKRLLIYQNDLSAIASAVVAAEDSG